MWPGEEGGKKTDLSCKIQLFLDFPHLLYLGRGVLNPRLHSIQCKPLELQQLLRIENLTLLSYSHTTKGDFSKKRKRKKEKRKKENQRSHLRALHTQCIRSGS